MSERSPQPGRAQDTIEPSYQGRALWPLAVRAARGKRRSSEVAAFMLDPWPALTQMAQELEQRSYHPARSRSFVIHEPKRRLIAALPFYDRVVQHVLIDASIASFERSFAPQSYACRVGKGTHRALRRATELHRNFRWVLRLDVARFFPSIDHQLLLRVILPRTPPSYRWLARRIVAAGGPTERVVHHFPGDELFTPIERPHGLPIGNLCSQIWANALLSPVDHLIASQLKLGCFVRYCDDLLIYDNDPARLREAWVAIERRCTALRLRLHPRKCRLHRTTEAVSFLGFVLQRRGRGVRVALARQNLVRFRRRHRAALASVRAGHAQLRSVHEAQRSWCAHAAHGHTRQLLRGALLS